MEGGKDSEVLTVCETHADFAHQHQDYRFTRVW
jgi:hypothetical protein